MALIIYITLVAAVTDDNPGISLTLLHGNERNSEEYVFQLRDVQK